MALGIKSQPNSVFEKGDLLYLANPENGSPVIYSKPTDEAESFALSTSPDGYIGIIEDANVDDVSEKIDKTGIWVWLLVRTHTNQLGYVTKDSTYTVKANPDYDYPKKKNSFDWSGVVNGISAISQTILNLFSKSQQQANPTGNTIGNNTMTTQQPVSQSWFQRNLLWVIIAPLFALIIWLLLKKEKPVAQLPYQAPAPPTGKRLNPNVKL